MPRSSGNSTVGGATRAQVEPLAALAAVFAVCAALALYAGVLADVTVDGGDRETTEIVADRVVERGSDAGVLDPSGIAAVLDVAPEGWKANATLHSEGKRWAYGHDPPPDAESATRRVGVRHEPGTVRPGTLRVVTWQ